MSNDFNKEEKVAFEDLAEGFVDGVKMLKKVKHHFVDIIFVKDSYSVFDYYLTATKKITELYKKNIPVIICGGSGLYLKVILDGIFKGTGKDKNLRKELEEKAHREGKEYLFEKLKKVDPKTAKKISSHDLKRIIRALEVYYLSGVPISEKKKEAEGLYGKLPMKIFGLQLKREILYERVNKRVEQMFKAGALEEATVLLKLNLSISAKQIIGIKEIGKVLAGEIREESAKHEDP